MLLCATALFVGGFTKGIAGLGLPLISIPLLTFVVNLPTAVVLLVIPVTASNLFQAFVPAIAVGAKLLVSLDEHPLYLVMGLSIVAVTVVARIAPGFVVSRRTERILNPIVGGLSGLLGGASSLFGPPLMVYFLTLRLEKAEYIATVSLLYFLGAGCFGLALILVGAFGWHEALLSALAMAPVFAGMMLGQAIGDRLDRHRFEQVLHGLYLLTALSFFYKAFT
jgi:uncharacterized membrane protein YfcA